jgi:hypothetical protein
VKKLAKLHIRSWSEYFRSRTAADLGTMRPRSVADVTGPIRKGISDGTDFDDTRNRTWRLGRCITAQRLAGGLV